MNKTKILGPLPKLFRSFSNTWYVFFPVAILMALFQPIFSYFNGYLLGGLMNVGSSKDFSDLLIILPYYLGGVLLCVTIYPLSLYLQETSLEKSTINLKERLLNHIVRLPVSTIQGTHSGNILAEFTVDADKAMIGCNLVTGMISALFVGNLVSLIYIFENSLTLGLVTVGVAIMSLIFNGAFAPYIRKLNVKERKRIAVLSEKLSDMLTGHTLINTDNKKEFFTTRVIKAVDNLFFMAWKLKKVHVIVSTPAELSRFLIDGIILATGVWLFNNGEMNMTQVMTCWTMGTAIGFSMRRIAKQYVELQSNLASGDRVATLLSKSVEDGGNHIIPDYSSSAVSFKNVDFSYQDGTEVYNDFSCEFKKGSSTVIVGKSGQGKSTALKLILKYYDIDSGIISVFGHDIRDYSLSALRSLISYVPQQPVLFNSSILENIRMGKPDANIDEVENAAKLAKAHDFIDALPQKYNTTVGERGAKLSGGQKQRIVIARAILKNAPILLMDEATSALDNRFEKDVREALSSISENLTVITVTHRLNTIPHNTRIIVVEQGKVVEEGTHDELVRLNQRYAQLLASQGE